MRRGLSRRQRSSLSALADALLPHGHGLPGATEVDVAARLDDRVASWHPRLRRFVQALVTSWEVAPLLSRHLRPFSALDPADAAAWTSSAYRSRVAARRLQVAALKQLVFLEWASAPQVEAALRYDYRCLRDDVARGNARPPERDGGGIRSGAEPNDYHRAGPATRSGAIPLHLLERRTFTRHERPALRTRSFPDLGDGHRESVDVVVIGSGAGGAVAAARVAEGGLDVLVVEEGRQVDVHDFEGPMFDRFQEFCRDHGTTQVWGTPPIPLPLGRVVGGTTVVNSGTCFRAPARVLDRWRREFGIEGCSAHELAPYYEDAEHELNVRPVPWSLLGFNGETVHRGASSLGYSGGPLLRNIADCHGCGQCAFGCPTDAKQAMHLSYLPRAQAAGARVFSGCRVERIVCDEGRAIGVVATILDERDRRRGTLHVRADHVVVAAGAVHSPALLRRSGIPDPSGQTGSNLRIHPATGVAGVFDTEATSWKGTLQSYYIDEFFDSHDLMFEATHTIPSIGAGSLPGIGAPALSQAADMSRMATLGFYVSDTSAGAIRSVRGHVVPTYRLNALDAHRIAQGIAIAAEVLLEAGATNVHAGLPGLGAITAREDLVQLRERHVPTAHLRLTAFHPMGTVRMGADPQRSVVDPYGRHHQVANLWVADASVFPTCVAVNPQMTIMAFAGRMAQELLSSEENR